MQQVGFRTVSVHSPDHDSDKVSLRSSSAAAAASTVTPVATGNHGLHRHFCHAPGVREQAGRGSPRAQPPYELLAVQLVAVVRCGGLQRCNPFLLPRFLVVLIHCEWDLADRPPPCHEVCRQVPLARADMPTTLLVEKTIQRTSLGRIERHRTKKEKGHPGTRISKEITP